MFAHWEAQIGVDHCIALGTMHTWFASVTVMKNFGQSRSHGNSRLPVTSSYSRQASAHTSQAAWVLLACSAVFVVLLAASSISGDLTHSVPRFLQQHIQVHGQPLQPELQQLATSCCLQISSMYLTQQNGRSKGVRCDFRMDGRFSLLVMGFCNLICASLSNNFHMAAGMQAGYKSRILLFCCIAKCQQIANQARSWQCPTHGRGLSFCTSQKSGCLWLDSAHITCSATYMLIWSCSDWLKS